MAEVDVEVAFDADPNRIGKRVKMDADEARSLAHQGRVRIVTQPKQQPKPAAKSESKDG